MLATVTPFRYIARSSGDAAVTAFTSTFTSGFSSCIRVAQLLWILAANGNNLSSSLRRPARAATSRIWRGDMRAYREVATVKDLLLPIVGLLQREDGSTDRARKLHPPVGRHLCVEVGHRAALIHCDACGQENNGLTHWKAHWTRDWITGH